jgi:hypothetical protein
MIFQDDFACRRFDITAAAELKWPVTSFLGSPHGQYPEFEREHAVEDRQRILRQILTPKDLWELNQQLGRTMRGRAYFLLQMILHYKTTVEMQSPHKTESGKRFLFEGQDG